MMAFEIGDQIGLASLRAVDRPDPAPAPGEAIVRVRAACLNHRDLKVLAGTYGPRRPPTRVPGSDGIGEVVALGAGVTAPQPGTRAICAHFCNWLDGAFSPAAFAHDLGITRDGWLAQHIAVPAAALVTVPDAVSDAQAVALPAAGLTAWNALVEVARIKAGDVVLLLGTGGVSILALKIARMHGARVAITSSSDAKLEQARNMGADIAINYRAEPDWAAAMLRATGGAGADIVVETGGLATLTHSISACAPNARIVLIGALGDASAAALPNFSSIVGKNLTLRGITAGNRRMLQDLVRAVAANDMPASIHRCFSFADTAAAYAFLQAGNHLGKVMIEMPA
jgi:NADPH:quinone reductase-like Zn-dependent oxidoreductase